MVRSKLGSMIMWVLELTMMHQDSGVQRCYTVLMVAGTSFLLVELEIEINFIYLHKPLICSLVLKTIEKTPYAELYRHSSYKTANYMKEITKVCYFHWWECFFIRIYFVIELIKKLQVICCKLRP